MESKRTPRNFKTGLGDKLTKSIGEIRSFVLVHHSCYSQC